MESLRPPEQQAHQIYWRQDHKLVSSPCRLYLDFTVLWCVFLHLQSSIKVEGASSNDNRWCAHLKDYTGEINV